MPLNEGAQERRALKGPWRELSYSKHVPQPGAPQPGERSPTQEKSQLRKSQHWSHTPTKDAARLINSHGQLCPDAGATSAPPAGGDQGPDRIQASRGVTELGREARSPARPRACPPPMLGPAGVPAALGGPTTTIPPSPGPKSLTWRQPCCTEPPRPGHARLQAQAGALHPARTTRSQARTISGPAPKGTT